jgi:hypothetical protein
MKSAGYNARVGFDSETVEYREPRDHRADHIEGHGLADAARAIPVDRRAACSLAAARVVLLELEALRLERDGMTAKASRNSRS